MFQKETSIYSNGSFIAIKFQFYLFVFYSSRNNASSIRLIIINLFLLTTKVGWHLFKLLLCFSWDNSCLNYHGDVLRVALTPTQHTPLTSTPLRDKFKMYLSRQTVVVQQFKCRSSEITMRIIPIYNLSITPNKVSMLTLLHFFFDAYKTLPLCFHTLLLETI